jgi:hypothetical protein
MTYLFVPPSHFDAPIMCHGFILMKHGCRILRISSCEATFIINVKITDCKPGKPLIAMFRPRSDARPKRIPATFEIIDGVSFICLARPIPMRITMDDLEDGNDIFFGIMEHLDEVIEDIKRLVESD